MPQLAGLGSRIKAVFLSVIPLLADKDEAELTLTNDRRLRTDASIIGPIIVTPAEPTLTPLGYEQITSVDNVTAATLTVPPGAKYAWVQIELGDARWRDDGTSPTATVGFPLLQDTGFFFQEGASLPALEFIAQTTDVTVNVSYYS